MPKMFSKKIHNEMRQYVRMDTVFPVEVLLRASEDVAFSLLQGFTRNVGRGGICLELKVIDPKVKQFLESANPEVELNINPAFSRKTIRARAKIIWLNFEDTAHGPHYRIGLAYKHIDGIEAKKILNYALKRKWIPRLVGFLVIFLLASILALSYRQERLVEQNRALVKQLVEVAETRSPAVEDLIELGEKRKKLQKEIKV